MMIPTRSLRAAICATLATCGVFGAVSCSAETSGSANTAAGALTGVWQVVNVRIDTESSRTVQYQSDDPRLTGRLLIFKPGQIASNIRSAATCERPSIEQVRTTAGALIKDTMAHRAEAPEVPAPKDFELPLADTAGIDVLWLKCASGDIGPVGPPGKSGVNWIARANGQLLMRWFDNSILVLQPVAAAAAPNASFDCKKAGLPTEKAVCGSIGLASFDRSVATAYAGAIRQYKEVSDADAVKHLQAGQKAWLAQRNQCNADAACLQKSMQDRLEALAQMP